jgi:hypothetical protein
MADEVAAALDGYVRPGAILLSERQRQRVLGPAAHALGVDMEVESGPRDWDISMFESARPGPYMFRFRVWLRRFNGIGTRYLRNYLLWFRCFDPPTRHPHQPGWSAVAPSLASRPVRGRAPPSVVPDQTRWRSTHRAIGPGGS